MSGALIDLVSKGVQDVYLSGDPQVSFYRQNYKRHTNFSMKPVELKPIGQQVAGSEIVLPIERKGDLLTYVWCDTDTPGGDDDSSIQTSLNKTPTEFSLHIGGIEIERQDAFFINYLWPAFLAPTSSKNVVPSDKKFFPLHFFHCDTQTTPLPLVATQYHNAEIRVKHSVKSAPAGVKYYANYVMLDTDERKFFVDNRHDLLITQTQKVQATEKGADLMYLNHPVKAVMWGHDESITTSNVQLRINGTDVFDTLMPGKYFSNVASYYHTKSANYTSDKVFMYPFGLYPCEHQPTGSCNFSRLDNAKFTWDTDISPKYAYAVNYNILTVDKGLAGLKFSN